MGLRIIWLLPLGIDPERDPARGDNELVAFRGSWKGT